VTFANVFVLSRGRESSGADTVRQWVLSKSLKSVAKGQSRELLSTLNQAAALLHYDPKT
jgi:hypothetical protein